MNQLPGANVFTRQPDPYTVFHDWGVRREVDQRDLVAKGDALCDEHLEDAIRVHKDSIMLAWRDILHGDSDVVTLVVREEGRSGGRRLDRLGALIEVC